MEPDLRENRLRTDLAALEALRAQSTILQFEASQPADRYTITFRGKGLARRPPSRTLELCSDRRERAAVIADRTSPPVTSASILGDHLGRVALFG